MNKHIMKRFTLGTLLWASFAAGFAGCNGQGEQMLQVDVYGKVTDGGGNPVNGTYDLCVGYVADQYVRNERTSCKPVEIKDGEFDPRKQGFELPLDAERVLSGLQAYFLDANDSGVPAPGLRDETRSTGIQAIAETGAGALHFEFKFLAADADYVKVETFAAGSAVETHAEHYQDVDLLWVIDNSKSMGPYQKKVTDGLVQIAGNFFQTGDRELRMSVITTDNDLAPRNPVILSSRTSSGAAVDPATLAASFKKEALVGIGGDSEERGLQSVDAFLATHEEIPGCSVDGKNCLFRKNALRGIIFLSDEHSSDYLSFAGETVDHTFEATQDLDRASLEADARKLADLMRRRLNAFFRKLDGSGDHGDPNYFSAAIVHPKCVLNCAPKWWDTAWGLEYSELINSLMGDPENTAGANSITADIAANDYSGLLQNLNKSIKTTVSYVSLKSFDLSRVGVKVKWVKLIFADGTAQDIPARAAHLNGKRVEIEASALPAGLPKGTQIQISYIWQ